MDSFADISKNYVYCKRATSSNKMEQVGALWENS